MTIRIISEMLPEIHTVEKCDHFLKSTVKTLNIGTPRPATVVVLNMKQFNFTMK